MKILKYIAILLVVLFIVGFAAVKWYSEDKPQAQKGQAADQLAQEMLATLNKAAFDSIPYLQFEFFRGGHKYFWDKKNNDAVIEWDENKVIMDLDEVAGVVYQNGKELKGEEKDKIRHQAWSLWCNDSFWLIAPYKCTDPGTTRSVTTTEDGKKGLLIEYVSGGVTPGDSYLWILDENNRPTGWKMWTKILPVQGMYTSWDGWSTYMGAQLATQHELAGREMSMKNVKAGSAFSEFGYNENPFVVLRNEQIVK